MTETEIIVDFDNDDTSVQKVYFQADQSGVILNQVFAGPLEKFTSHGFRSRFPLRRNPNYEGPPVVFRIASTEKGKTRLPEEAYRATLRVE